MKNDNVWLIIVCILLVLAFPIGVGLAMFNNSRKPPPRFIAGDCVQLISTKTPGTYVERNAWNKHTISFDLGGNFPVNHDYDINMIEECPKEAT